MEWVINRYKLVHCHPIYTHLRAGTLSFPKSGSSSFWGLPLLFVDFFEHRVIWRERVGANGTCLFHYPPQMSHNDAILRAFWEIIMAASPNQLCCRRPRKQQQRRQKVETLTRSHECGKKCGLNERITGWAKFQIKKRGGGAHPQVM